MIGASRAVLVRPAVRDDFPRIANLLRQLYVAELPGALRGAHAAQQSLLRFTLEAKHAQGLHGRYVACTSTGDVVATATIEYPGAVAYERAPDGTIAQALRLLGFAGTVRLLVVVAKSLIGPPHQRAPDAVWLHSVVVDEHYRGQGIAQVLMTNLEQQAAERNYRTAWLQVLAMNQPARQMYERLGYQQAWASPRWQRLLTWPSYLLCKTLVVI